MSDRTEPDDFCPSCGGRPFVMPRQEEFLYALPATGWRAYFWSKPDDAESTETRSEPLEAWGITRKGEVHPLLKSEDPDAFEDGGDDFAFLAPASATHRELRKFRREARAERERLRAFAKTDA